MLRLGRSLKAHEVRGDARGRLFFVRKFLSPRNTQNRCVILILSNHNVRLEYAHTPEHWTGWLPRSRHRTSLRPHSTSRLRQRAKAIGVNEAELASDLLEMIAQMAVAVQQRSLGN